MSEYRTFTRNILRHYRQASAQVREDGRIWYDNAYRECLQRRGSHSTLQAVCAVAHLSPRTRWEASLLALSALLSGGERPGQCLQSTWARAMEAANSETPMATFSMQARKTRAFAEAILGDPNAVVVDVWAARVAGASETLPASRGGYMALVDSYHRAARIERVTPREMQAVTWCKIRSTGRAT